jgi:hypothetical protein
LRAELVKGYVICWKHKWEGYDFMKGVLKFLALAALPGLATAGTCLPVVGTVKLVPESTCMISSKYPNLFFLGTVDSSQPWCFTTTLRDCRKTLFPKLLQ